MDDKFKYSALIIDKDYYRYLYEEKELDEVRFQSLQ
jgi:hypothetical protein